MKTLWIVVKGVIWFVVIMIGGTALIGFTNGMARSGIPDFPSSEFVGLSMIILMIFAVIAVALYLRRQIKKSKKLLEGEGE